MAMNAGPFAHSIHISVADLGWQEGRLVENLLDIGSASAVSNGQVEVSLPSWSGTWLM
jgi:hypothetical protein